MNELKVTWDIVWRIRQRGVVPALGSDLEFDDEELKNLCRRWVELHSELDKIDRRFKEMALSRTGEE